MNQNSTAVTISSDDVLTVSTQACTLNVGAVALMGDYNTHTSTALLFKANAEANRSSVSYAAADRTIKITLGVRDSGTANTTAAASAAAKYSPSENIKGVNGLAVETAQFTNPAASRF